MWLQIIVNLLLTGISGFGIAYAATGDLHSALAAGITAMFGNQVGLHQNPPTRKP